MLFHTVICSPPLVLPFIRLSAPTLHGDRCWCRKLRQKFVSVSAACSHQSQVLLAKDAGFSGFPWHSYPCISDLQDTPPLPPAKIITFFFPHSIPSQVTFWEPLYSIQNPKPPFIPNPNSLCAEAQCVVILLSSSSVLNLYLL